VAAVQIQELFVTGETPARNEVLIAPVAQASSQAGDAEAAHLLLLDVHPVVLGVAQ
jgi:hypothetical protein